MSVESTERERAQRNLHPHKAAVAAMHLWGAEYAAQRGGSMDFWDRLTSQRQYLCRDLVTRMAEAPEES